MSERTHRLFELDLLRIVAALAVVLFHYTFSGPAHGMSPGFPHLAAVTRFGYLGVDLFFLVSGFVVLMTAWQRRASDFVISRVVRLYPAYWFAVTLTAGITGLLGRGLFDVSVGQYLVNLTMFQAVPDVRNVDVVYWTLWTELRFYALIFVFALVGITRRRMVVALWAWLAACGALESGLLPNAVHRYADLVVQTYYAHYFIAGMALFLAYRFGMSWGYGAIVVAAFGNALLRGAQFTHQLEDQYRTHFHPVVAAAVIGAIFGVFVAVALRWTTALARPWFAVAGALTYPLYLVHAHLGFLALHRLSGNVDVRVLVPALILAMGGFAYAIHRFVERPLAPRLKRWLTSLTNRRNTPSPIVPASKTGAV
jgi:peptidoglycan/LPS O-acetylase OafA/YrhL